MNTDPNVPSFYHQNPLLPLHMCELGRSPSPKTSATSCCPSVEAPTSTSFDDDMPVDSKVAASNSPINFLIPDPLFASTNLLTRTATQPLLARRGIPHFLYDSYDARPSHVSHFSATSSSTCDNDNAHTPSSTEIFAPTPIHSTATPKSSMPELSLTQQGSPAPQTSATHIFSTHYLDAHQTHLTPPPSLKTKETPRHPSRGASSSDSSIPELISPAELFEPYFFNKIPSYARSRVNLKKWHEIYLDTYAIANQPNFNPVRREAALHISFIIETIILKLFPILDTLYLTITTDLSDDELDLIDDGTPHEPKSDVAVNSLANNAKLFCTIAPVRRELNFLLSSQSTYSLHPLPAFYSLYQINSDYEKTRKNFSKTIINASTDLYFRKFSKVLQEQNERMDKLVQDENFNMKNPLLTVQFPLKPNPSKPRFLCPSSPCIVSTDIVPRKKRTSSQELLKGLKELNDSLPTYTFSEPRPFVASALASSPDLFSENAFQIFAQLHDFLAASEKKMSLFLANPTMRKQAHLFTDLLGAVLYLQNNLFFHHLYRVPHKLSFLQEQIICASKIFLKLDQTHESSINTNQACSSIASHLWKLSQIFD